MRITFTLPTLFVGGAERTVSNMANYWAARGWEITILTLSHGMRPPGFDLHPAVTHRDIAYYQQPDSQRQSTELGKSLLRILEASSEVERGVIEAEGVRLEKLRSAIITTRPDAVISFECATNVRVLLATSDMNLPVVVSERSDPQYTLLKGEGWVRLRRRLYPRAAWLVTLTEDARRYFAPQMGNRGRVIPNFVLQPEVEIDSCAPSRDDPRKVIALGRLAPVKGFDLLLKAFAEVAPRHPQWGLEIWGEGAILCDLERLASELGVAERVRFGGLTKHTHETLRRADLFVLSSLYEGFPNAMCEAMACGLPVISFDCPSGPRSIIRHGVDGLLVPPGDVEALAAGMGRLMQNEAERKRLGQRAAEVIERYSPEKVMALWEGLLLNDARQVRLHDRVSGGIPVRTV